MANIQANLRLGGSEVRVFTGVCVRRARPGCAFGLAWMRTQHYLVSCQISPRTTNDTHVCAHAWGVDSS